MEAELGHVREDAGLPESLGVMLGAELGRAENLVQFMELSHEAMGDSLQVDNPLDLPGLLHILAVGLRALRGHRNAPPDGGVRAASSSVLGTPRLLRWT